ncbi:hypothetical protein EG878_16200 [Enterococcus faecalis]|nr:hypothetical protein EG878_16200 [Enterococcus faecalis]
MGWEGGPGERGRGGVGGRQKYPRRGCPAPPFRVRAGPGSRFGSGSPAPASLPGSGPVAGPRSDGGSARLSDRLGAPSERAPSAQARVGRPRGSRGASRVSGRGKRGSRGSREWQGEAVRPPHNTETTTKH